MNLNESKVNKTKTFARSPNDFKNKTPQSKIRTSTENVVNHKNQETSKKSPRVNSNSKTTNQINLFEKDKRFSNTNSFFKAESSKVGHSKKLSNGHSLQKEKVKEVQRKSEIKEKVETTQIKGKIYCKSNQVNIKISKISPNPKTKVNQPNFNNSLHFETPRLGNLSNSQNRDPLVKSKINEGLEKEVKLLKNQIEKNSKLLSQKDIKIKVLENKVKQVNMENTKLKAQIKEQKKNNDNLANALQRYHHAQGANDIHIPYSRLLEIFNINQNQDLNEIILGSQVNPDAMSYEELLELGEKIGKVEKGFKLDEIALIPVFKYKKNDNSESCTICQYDLKDDEDVKKLTCSHVYHQMCVDEWLSKEKNCPMCKKEVVIM